MSNLLLSDAATLKTSDSVGVVLLTTSNEYLLQRRWNRSGFYFPGYWGLFGGGLKRQEDPETAARREILEELGLRLGDMELIMEFDFDFSGLRLNKITRWFFKAHISERDIGAISLNEGDEVRAFSAEEALSQYQLVPYDAFAIWVHESRHRLIPFNRNS
jgi:8-oxo-dGTP pyrophosphatase MutT (NUDIX family)